MRSRNFSATDSTVYVANQGFDNVSIIPSGSVVATSLQVGFNPRFLAVTPNGASVYVANQNDNNVSIIDTAQINNPMYTTPTIPVGNSPLAVAITPDGRYVYVSNSGDNSISVIDTTQINTPMYIPPTYPVGSSPQSIAITTNPAPPPPPPPPPLPPLPPLTIAGKQAINKLPFQKQFFNTLTWTASPSTDIQYYKIYRNGQPITSISANQPLTYNDYFINRKLAYTYSITAVNTANIESNALSIFIK